MRKLTTRLSTFYNNHQDFSNVFLLVILCSIVFFNSLFINLLEVDDFNSLLHHSSDFNFKKILTTNTYGYNEGGNYRPIEVLSYKITSLIYGQNNTVGRHFTNILVHIFNVILIYFLVSILTTKRKVGLIAASLFSVFIIHSYSLSPVSWISGRVDLFVTLFYLISILLFIKYISSGSLLIYICSIMSFCLSLLSKEMAVTLPLIIILYSWFFLSKNKVEKDINPALVVRLLWIAIIGGILTTSLGFILTPNFFASLLSPDKKLYPDTIQKIQFYLLVLKYAGAAISFVGVVVLLLFKYIKQKFYVLTLWYSLPYFAVLIFYFVVRFFALGGFGGLYQSSGGGAVNFNFNFDAFLRDNLGLAALVWPVGKEYYETILKMEANNSIIFYTFALILLFSFCFTFYLLIRKKQKYLLFGFLWLIITVAPVHNILVTPWYFNQRYFYLPTIGFCILISILFFNLLERTRNTSLYIKYSIITVFLIILSINSLLIAKHNEVLRKSGTTINAFVEDIRRLEPFISDSSRLFFITYPFTPISSKGCVFVEAYLSDIFTTINKNWRSLKYNILLYSKTLNDNGIEINWIDDKSFIIELAYPDQYAVVPANLSPLDKKIRILHKGIPFHAMLQELPEQGKSLLVNGAMIESLALDEKFNRAKIKVYLEDSLDIANPNTLFLDYKKGNWNIVKISNRLR